MNSKKNVVRCGCCTNTICKRSQLYYNFSSTGTNFRSTPKDKKDDLNHVIATLCHYHYMLFNSLVRSSVDQKKKRRVPFLRSPMKAVLDYHHFHFQQIFRLIFPGFLQAFLTTLIKSPVILQRSREEKKERIQLPLVVYLNTHSFLLTRLNWNVRCLV